MKYTMLESGILGCGSWYRAVVSYDGGLVVGSAVEYS